MFTQHRSHRLIPLLVTGLTLIATQADAHPEGTDPLAGNLAQDLGGSLPRDLSAPPEPVPHLSHTIHLEFGGGNNGNRIAAPQCDGTTFPVFPDAGKAASILQEVQNHWADFEVNVMDQVPASGTYTTVILGQNNCCGGVGVAPVVCGTDDLNAVAHVCDVSLGVDKLATAVSQEAAHTYGLMHVNDPSEIMNPSTAGGTTSFKDACYAYSPAVCAGQRVHCSGDQQNSYQELLAIFGSSVPDTAAPTVAITSPADGDTFAAGSSFDITADASDDKQVLAVELVVNGMAMGTDDQPPYEWGVAQIPAGTYEIMAIASDLAGNSTDSAVVTITVSEGGDPTGDTSSGSTSDGGTGDGSGGGTTGGSGGGGDGGLVPEGGSEGGCGCATGEGPGGLAWMLLGPLVLLRRRR